MVGSQFELPRNAPFGPVAPEAPTPSWGFSQTLAGARFVKKGPCLILSCEFLQRNRRIHMDCRAHAFQNSVAKSCLCSLDDPRASMSTA